MSPRRRPTAGRGGFTLVELMVAMTLLVLVFAAAVPLFQTQSRLVARHAGRADAVQRARFAVAAIERDLRIAGAPNANEDQPLLVQIDPMAVTFNVDLNSRDTTSVSAVYFDPDVPAGQARSMQTSAAVTLPRSATVYPQVEYLNTAGARSDAETISYWISRDMSVTRADQYILWRRVNDGDSTTVARGIIVRAGQPFFEYLQPGAGDTLRVIAANRLPSVHAIARHGGVGDTGAVALTDSVRSVRLRFETLYRDLQRGDTTYAVRAGFRLLNAGLVRRNTCGSPPLAVTLSATALPGNVVRLSWNRSVDDGAGEQDAVRYALYRRLQGTTAWSEPFRGIAARRFASYTHDDTDAKPADEWWEYSVMVQDCTPSSSPRSNVATVQIIP